MLRWMLFLVFFTNSFALELSILGAKEAHQKYSTLHIKDDSPFICEETLNDFKEVTQIICAFKNKPSANVKELQNSFFNISNKTKDKTYFLIIKPFSRIKLFPIVFDMTKDTSLYNPKVSIAKHWMAIGYIENIPYIKNEDQIDTAINFPFELSQSMFPYVGGLDIKGNPVQIKKVGDVTEFLRIKKFYNNKEYDRCLDLIEEVMAEYPNSLFMAELIFYKIRVYAKLDANDNVIDLSKEFLREHSADENIPEVLAYIANAYAQIGMPSDADYFFDRLFDEHPENEFAKWGYIYKAKMLESEGSDTLAIKLYKKALHETKDIEIASTAAYSLAKYFVGAGNKLEASKYIMKIVGAKADFFMTNLGHSMDMMYSYADEEDYKMAATIANALLSTMPKQHDEHERLLKDAGIWLAKTDEKVNALNTLNKYLKEYEGGLFQEQVEIAKDGLFFDTNDANFTAKLAEYETLMLDYVGDSIGNRAIYEKGKLLRDNKKFAEVLDFKDKLYELDKNEYQDIDAIVHDAAYGVMTTSLKNKKCQGVLDISNEYNITLSNDWDDGVYECAMMGGDYQLSKTITARNLNSQDINLRKLWLYRHIKADFATGNYSDVIDASKEMITLIEGEKSSPYLDIYRIVFDTYQRLESKDKLFDAISNIQKVYGNDFLDLERYVAVMSYGTEIKDDNMVIQYGEEVHKIQRSSNSNAQSPFVEFALFQSYINKENLEKALDVILSLENVKLNKTNKARQKYMLGTVYSKLWRDEEAQKAFQESIDADPESSWAKLAKSAKGI